LGENLKFIKVTTKIYEPILFLGFVLGSTLRILSYRV
jgi:hypothetical protein